MVPTGKATGLKGLYLGLIAMKNKLLIIVAIVLTSISTGYSLETTKTTFLGKSISEHGPEIDANSLTEILESSDKYQPRVLTTQKTTFSIQYKGAESLMNEVTRLMGNKKETID